MDGFSRGNPLNVPVEVKRGGRGDRGTIRPALIAAFPAVTQNRIGFLHDGSARPATCSEPEFEEGLQSSASFFRNAHCPPHVMPVGHRQSAGTTAGSSGACPELRPGPAVWAVRASHAHRPGSRLNPAARSLCRQGFPCGFTNRPKCNRRIDRPRLCRPHGFAVQSGFPGLTARPGNGAPPVPSWRMVFGGSVRCPRSEDRMVPA